MKPKLMMAEVGQRRSGACGAPFCFFQAKLLKIQKTKES